MRTEEILDSPESEPSRPDRIVWRPTFVPSNHHQHHHHVSSLAIDFQADTSLLFAALVAAARAAAEFGEAVARVGVVFDLTGETWSTFIRAQKVRQERRRVRASYRRRTVARRRRGRRA